MLRITLMGVRLLPSSHAINGSGTIRRSDKNTTATRRYSSAHSQRIARLHAERRTTKNAHWHIGQDQHIVRHRITLARRNRRKPIKVPQKQQYCMYCARTRTRRPRKPPDKNASDGWHLLVQGGGRHLLHLRCGPNDTTTVS